ncbi:transporter substrate-binding domain-containing protein [Streptosporangium roseum]|uniref:ABC-type amino acid transport/signal transduction systems periplasmic component/domain-like protein n=1 Tax=Streptosporangium roseum (strain ATCC 12428 / DSM 43021 / JCM 3005 / KCTC 9067 / NCIMB 10171 / NRRL 2505 / NI 9100) TaxID=479432 RepID=D2AZP2_STRRD|nr:transporter substrate-binding domain-containing protein [Streptosporangium roseum]ACZ85287.1 ABC-type amino acid transport/signal transduction systems periplasmic component/domain-like protein [Streptosporangium roseum DSM 43021]
MTEEPADSGARAEDPPSPSGEHEPWSGPEPEPGSPPAPDSPPASGRSRRVRRFRLAAWVALVLAAIVVGASIMWVNGPPTEAELREKAGLFNKDRLRIGVKTDTPGIAFQEQTGRRAFKGFDIQVAYLIAADLGYRPDKVDFLGIETEDRARMQALDANGRFVGVDLVVATFSVTRARQEDPSVGFSTPYLYTEQSVVTRSDYPGKITSLGQLEGKKVCTLGTSTSETELARATRATVTAKNLISDCATGLKDGDFDAMTTDAAILAGFVAESGGAFRHHDIALEKTEMWAVNAGSNEALRTLVDLALYRSYADPQDQRWEQAYQAYIDPLLPASPNVNVAQAEQPCALPPPVRRWPWERTLPVQDCPSR